jgi:hypothetical protein
VFRLEADMLPIIAANLETVIQHPGPHVLALELPVNSRVVDIAIAALSERALDEVLDSNHLSRLRATQLDMLARVVHAQRISIQRLARDTYLTTSKLRCDYLDEFLDQGLIARVSRYCYAPTSWASYLPSVLVTVEAKLLRSQQVFAQALDNMEFADRSYAALPDTMLKHNAAALQATFGSAGVGLIQVSKEGLREVVPAGYQGFVSLSGTWQRLRLLRDLQMPSHRHKKWRLVR